MATFAYKAKTTSGEVRSGIIEASSSETALDLLHQNNLLVLSISEQGAKSIWERGFSLGQHVSQKDVVIFSRQLATLFQANIPAAASLKTLVGETEKTPLRNAITNILDDVTGGLALSQALAKHSDIFSPFYIYMVRSGEESGKLQEVFTYLADYLERSYYLMSKARNAMIYPAFVLFAFTVVLIVMLVFIIPNLVTIFQEANQDVPFYTQIIISLSLFLRQWGIFLLIIFIGAVISGWRWALTLGGKRFFQRLQLQIPIVGTMYKKMYMARFTDNLRTLIIGGIPIIRALEVTKDVVGNAVYEDIIGDAIESVKGGGSISAALEKYPEVPVLVTQMIRIGESSGRLDFILGNIAQFYQKEVDSLVDNLVALIEPLLIIFLGAGIGILVASIMVPLYNLVGNT